MMMDKVGDTMGQPKLLNETFFKSRGGGTGEARKRREHVMAGTAAGRAAAPARQVLPWV